MGEVGNNQEWDGDFTDEQGRNNDDNGRFSSNSPHPAYVQVEIGHHFTNTDKHDDRTRYWQQPYPSCKIPLIQKYDEGVGYSGRLHDDG